MFTSDQDKLKLEAASDDRSDGFDDDTGDETDHDNDSDDSDDKDDNDDGGNPYVNQDDRDTRGSTPPEESPMERLRLHDGLHVSTPSKRKRTSALEKESDGKRPYICTHPACGKAYKKPCKLAEHERLHTGEVGLIDLQILSFQL